MKIETQQKWMMRRHISDVIALNPMYTEDSLTKLVRNRNVIGIVAEFNLMIVGYMIYKLNNKNIEILDICVDRNHRRMGVGTALLKRLDPKLESAREVISTICHECNLDFQLFLRTMGYHAIKVERDFYNNNRDAYIFHKTNDHTSRSNSGRKKVGTRKNGSNQDRGIDSQ